jgi:AcrR family transcriptional regulator
MNKDRWGEILEASARLFREKGYRATTMGDIADELGITKPALYYYIKTKHDLLYEICKSAIQQLMDGVRKINESEASPEEKLHDLITWHVNMFSENGDIINVYLADEGELPSKKKAYIRSLSREYELIYRHVVEQAVEQKTFREIDVPMAVRAISGMCNWLSSWYKPDGRQSADEIAEIFFDMVVKGCRK